MSTSIFIKTYANDIPWLRFCLESIRKYSIGFDEVVIAADKDCIKQLEEIAVSGERLVPVEKWDNGYIQQQYVKLHADQHVTSDNVLFVDSDCVFFDYFSENSFMVGRKPILLKTLYSKLEGVDAWKQITEKSLGWTVEWEYMRRLPLIYKTESLTAFRNAFHDVVSGMKQISGNAFTEFNVLGAFIEKYEAEKYFICDTEKWIPNAVARQFWSYGGLNGDVINEIESCIHRQPVTPDELGLLRSRDEIGHVMNSMGMSGRGAEIGVAFGENAEQILSVSNLSELLLVDPWGYVSGENSRGFGDAIKDWNGCYEYCLKKLTPFGDRAKIMRMTSLEASQQVPDESLDFVYIDGNHMSPYIDNDLKYWYPKVRKGGIFGGHDYHNYENSIFTCNVKDAVDNFFTGTDKQLFIVPGEVPSWYVVKQ